MHLERVRFFGLTRAQVHAASRLGGGRQRPEREEETVGHYAMVQGAYMRLAGVDALAGHPQCVSSSGGAAVPALPCGSLLSSLCALR